MSQQGIFGFIIENSTLIAGLALGGLIGAVNRAAKSEPASLARMTLEGVAAVGTGIAFGGVFYSGIASITGSEPVFAAICASSVGAFIGDKAYQRSYDKYFAGGKDAASGK